jgi:transposase
MTRHVERITRAGAVALRTALDPAVQLGRGDKVNRHAKVANSTKCRDSALLTSQGNRPARGIDWLARALKGSHRATRMPTMQKRKSSP